MKAKRHWKDIATLEDALSHGLMKSEFEHVCKVLGRDINMVELGVCSALFSEHCSYKSSKVHLRNFPTKGERVIQGPGENAGVIDVGDGQAVAFKVESHNHPSFIEPYQGAATGVGGILRDVFTMGARPVALMNALRFGEISNQRTPYLLRRCVQGIGGYGNCMGIPTVGGELYFDQAYNGNCLVNAFALGIVDTDKIFLGKASGIGNAIFYVGSKTGRDGIHGASMASESFDDDSEEKRPTVQVGDPFQEKLLLEACLEIMASGAVVGIQDMGAAGITSSAYEMADRAGSGIRLDLDRVPQREEGMNPYEIMLSESQERMLVIVARGRESEMERIFSKWDLDAAKIGEVTQGDEVKLYWNGECISTIKAAVLTRAVPEYTWPEKAPADFEQRNKPLVPSNVQLSSDELSKRWRKLATSPNLCSRFPIFRQYDSTVRSNTVIHPGGDAALIRLKRNRDTELAQCTVDSYSATQNAGPAEKGIAMTLDCNSRYCDVNPKEGAALSLAEACRNIAAVGATPIGISDNLNFGNPQKPEGMWQFAEAVRGLCEAARAYKVPVVSGNVSLYNETKGTAILPTPLLAVVGLIEDASKAVGSQFVDSGDSILLLGATNPSELGGSEYQYQNEGRSYGKLPALDYALEQGTADFIRELIADRLIASCHDVSQGGVATALLECCFSSYKASGATLKMEKPQGSHEGLLFAETGARYIVSVKPEKLKEVLQRAQSRKIPVTGQGRVGGEQIAIEGVASLPVVATYNEWRQALEPLLAA